MDTRRTLEDKFGREFIAELLTALEFSTEDEDLLWAMAQGEEWAQKKFFSQGGATSAGVVQPSFVRIMRFLEYLSRVEQSPLPVSMPARATFQTHVGPEEFAKILAHFAPGVRSNSKLYDRFLAWLRVARVPPDYDSVHGVARRFTAIASGSDEAEFAMKAIMLSATLGGDVASNELLLYRGKQVLEAVVSQGRPKPRRGFIRRLFGR